MVSTINSTHQLNTPVTTFTKYSNYIMTVKLSVKMVYCNYHEKKFKTNSCTIKQTFLYQTFLVIYKGKDGEVMYLLLIVYVYSNVQKCINKIVYGSHVLIMFWAWNTHNLALSNSFAWIRHCTNVKRKWPFSI